MASFYRSFGEKPFIDIPLWHGICYKFLISRSLVKYLMTISNISMFLGSPRPIVLMSFVSKNLNEINVSKLMLPEGYQVQNITQIYD